MSGEHHFKEVRFDKGVAMTVSAFEGGSAIVSGAAGGLGAR
jgi:hypothetical protein